MIKKIIIITIFYFSLLFSGFENDETGWTYTQSVLQAFYMLQSTQIDGFEVESGDVVGAFKDGVCVGWVYADPGGYTTIPLMGADSSNSDLAEYMNSGDVADLYIYDATYGSILPLDVSDTSTDLDGDFNDDLFGELPEWENFGLFIINGISTANNTFGCSDENACNYDSDVTADDGSCWSANDGCDCSQGQGSETDCAGVCNGVSEFDDCGVCGGGNLDQDCGGICFGGNTVDSCGVCDSDSSNDDASCTGCTDECADNYDSGNLFDDGSCSYTIPSVENVTSDPGPNKITLFWTAVDVCGSSISYEVYNSNGNFIKETSNTTTQITDLDAGIEYCFFIVALNENSSSEASDIVCDVPEEVAGWAISISLNVEVGEGYVSDVSNELGMIPDATDGYDNNYDIPEPPTSPADWASFYFPHADWFIDLSDNFTSDYKELQDLSNKLSIWEAEFVSDIAGPASLGFDFTNNAGDWPIYFKLQTTNDPEVFQYYRLLDSTSIDFSYIPPNEIRSAEIIIGNSYPGPPTDFEAIGGPRKMDLYWADRPLCEFDEDICNDPNNRYPETAYKIFKNSDLRYLITLTNHEISFNLDQIFTNDDESLINILEYPQNGEMLIDCYESYIDINMNGEYDIGDSFEDCGLDGLCEDDEEYIQSDIGESDGLCNRSVQYTPYFNFSGEDSIVISDSNGDSYVLDVSVVDEMIYEYSDEYLLGSQFYSYYMIAYNHAGDSEPSLLASDVTEPNMLPIADAGDSRSFYLYNPGQETVEVILPHNNAEDFEDGNNNGQWDEGESYSDDNLNGQWDIENNNNQSYDPDAFEGETLTYSWEKQLESDSSWVVVSSESFFSMVLDINLHHFRHRVKDITGMWGNYDYVDIDVKGLPEPAQIASLDIIPNLYYLELSWPFSEYTESDWPEGYDGSPFLAYTYEIYYQDSGELVATLGEGEASFIDNGLNPSTNYCYDIYGINVQGLPSPSQSSCQETGDSPQVNLLNPSGGEIIESGSEYVIDWEIENLEYVDSISLLYTSSSEDVNWELIYSSEDLSLSASVQIPEVDGITLDNLFSIIINDKGDFYGDNVNSYSDQNDYKFIISNSTLSYDIDLGINLVGTPLIPNSPLFEDNFCPNYGIDGICLSFDEYGDLALGSNIIIGEGYYFVNLYDETITIDGQLLADYTIGLNQGWNLISNPIVSDMRVDSLKISYAETDYLWGDALNQGSLVAPFIIGYDNLGSVHSIDNIVKPFKGYWIHSSSDEVDLVFDPHIYDDSYIESDPLEIYDWKMRISASEKDPSNPAFSISDFVIIGLDPDADDGFLYSEDIYDIPAILNYRYTNLYINHSSDWFSSNVIDDNGIPIESPRFMTDFRLPVEVDDFKEWNISGELLGPINSSDSLKIEWEMDELAGIYPIQLLIADNIIDMREESYVYITGEEFNQFSIQMGDETLDNDSFLISDFTIKDPYPNPFNPVTQLSFNIPLSDYIEINMHDINGNVVERLYDGYISSGNHVIEWNAAHVSSGIYFFKAEYQNQIVIKKAILIK